MDLGQAAERRAALRVVGVPVRGVAVAEQSAELGGEGVGRRGRVERGDVGRGGGGLVQSPGEGSLGRVVLTARGWWYGLKGLW